MHPTRDALSPAKSHRYQRVQHKALPPLALTCTKCHHNVVGSHITSDTSRSGDTSKGTVRSPLTSPFWSLIPLTLASFGLLSTLVLESDARYRVISLRGGSLEDHCHSVSFSNISHLISNTYYHLLLLFIHWSSLFFFFFSPVITAMMTASIFSENSLRNLQDQLFFLSCIGHITLGIIGNSNAVVASHLHRFYKYHEVLFIYLALQSRTEKCKILCKVMLMQLLVKV